MFTREQNLAAERLLMAAPRLSGLPRPCRRADASLGRDASHELQLLVNAERSALGPLAARLSAVRNAARARFPAPPEAAAVLGVLLFLLGCWGVGALDTGSAALLFVPAIAWEAVAFGPVAALVTLALSALAGWALLGHVSTAPWTFLYCLLAGAPVALVSALSEAVGRQAEALREARREAAMRDALFAEAQHRLGNNLSVICAALGLQARKSRDPATKRALQEATERVMLIAEVNRMLAASESDAMPFNAAFVERLVGKCIAAAGAEDRVRYLTAIEPIDVRADHLLPIALVLAESVNNALEHGFPGDAVGAIEISLEASVDGKSRLTIIDNGAGIPAGFDADQATTTGLVLIRAFVRQVDGIFRLESDGPRQGARSTFTF